MKKIILSIVLLTGIMALVSCSLNNDPIREDITFEDLVMLKNSQKAILLEMLEGEEHSYLTRSATRAGGDMEDLELEQILNSLPYHYRQYLLLYIDGNMEIGEMSDFVLRAVNSDPNLSIIEKTNFAMAIGGAESLGNFVSNIEIQDNPTRAGSSDCTYKYKRKGWKIIGRFLMSSIGGLFSGQYWLIGGAFIDAVDEIDQAKIELYACRRNEVANEVG